MGLALSHSAQYLALIATGQFMMSGCTLLAAACTTHAGSEVLSTSCKNT